MENNKFCIKVLNKEHGKEVIEYLMSLPNTKNPLRFTGSSVGSYYYIYPYNWITCSLTIPEGYTESGLLTTCITKSVKITKPIDNVTTENLKYALLLCNIDLCPSVIDKIIDLVELLEEKGDNVSFKEIIELKNLWDK